MVGRSVATLLAISIASQASAPSIADWRWLDQVREAAFESLMPVKAPRLLAAYRSHRDLYQRVPERHFRVGLADSPNSARDTLVATVVTPAGRSIQEQLLDLHTRSPQASFESLISQLAVRRVVLSEEKCPAIRTRMDALPRVSVPSPLRDLLFLHPVEHRIVIRQPGAMIDATVLEQDNPLVRWAIETLDALVACGAR